LASAAFTATCGYTTTRAVAAGYRAAMVVVAALAGLGMVTAVLSRRVTERPTKR
jgi:hypothetical protein